jgi:hypothetical protein
MPGPDHRSDPGVDGGCRLVPAPPLSRMDEPIRSSFERRSKVPDGDETRARLHLAAGVLLLEIARRDV